MNNLDNIPRWQRNINKLRLEISPKMQRADDEQIHKHYNGAGAEWMPAKLRNIFDSFLSLYRECVAIHDWDFSHSDGSEYSFKVANERFKKNMKKVRDYHFPWSNPFLYGECFRWYLRARAAYRAVQLGGWKAWQDGYNANQNKIYQDFNKKSKIT